MSQTETAAEPSHTPLVAAVGAPAEVDIAALVLTEAELARALRVSTRTMQRLRLEGGGPRFIKLTEKRVAYAMTDIQAWLRARSMSSGGSKVGVPQ